MPATIDTVEQFREGIAEEEIMKEVKLRIKAGAISSVYSGSTAQGWTLTTKWNVIGEQ